MICDLNPNFQIILDSDLDVCQCLIATKITYQITYQTRPPQGKLAQPQESHRLK